MFLRLFCYTFLFLIVAAFIALVWDYTRIFLNNWQLSKLPNSNLSDMENTSTSALDNKVNVKFKFVCLQTCIIWLQFLQLETN
jgi:hypothetical protein